MIRRMLLWFTMFILVGSLTSAQDPALAPDANTASSSLKFPDQLSRENPDTAAMWPHMTEEEQRTILEAWGKYQVAQQEVIRLQTQAEGLQTRIAAAQTELQGLEQESEDAKTKLEILKEVRDLDNEISRLDEEIANKEEGIKDREAELQRWREGGMEETHPTYQERLRLLNDEKARLEAMKTEKAGKEARRSELLRKLTGRDLYGRDGQRFADHDEVLDEIARLEQRIGQLDGTRQDRLETTRGPDGKLSARTVTETTPGLIDRKKGEIEDLEGQLKETQDKIPPAQEAADALRAELHKVKTAATAAAAARMKAEETKRQEKVREQRLREQRDAEMAAIQRKIEHYEKKIEVIREFAPLKFTGPLALLVWKLDEEEAKDLANLMAVWLDDPERREALIELIEEIPKYVEATRQGAEATADFFSGVPAGVTAAGGTLRSGRKVLQRIRSARFGVTGVFPATNALLVGARVALLYWDIHDPTKPQAAMLYPVDTVANSRFVTDEKYSDLWKGVEGADRRLRAVQIVENIQEFNRDLQAFARQVSETILDPDVKEAYDEFQDNPELRDRFEEGLERVASQPAEDAALEKYINSEEYQEWKFFDGDKVPLAEGQTLDEWARAEAEDVRANPDAVDEDAEDAKGRFRRYFKDFLRTEGLLGRLDDRGRLDQDERLASSQAPGMDSTQIPISVAPLLPDQATPATTSAKVTVTDAEGNVVVGLTLILRNEEGTEVVTTDDKGQAEVSATSYAEDDVVISGPHLPDRKYPLGVIAVGDDPLSNPFYGGVDMFFDDPVTPEQKKELETIITTTARVHLGNDDVTARLDTRPGVGIYDASVNSLAFGLYSGTYNVADAADSSMFYLQAGQAIDPPKLESSLGQALEMSMETPSPNDITVRLPVVVVPDVTVKTGAELKTLPEDLTFADDLNAVVSGLVATGLPNADLAAGRVVTEFDGILNLGVNGQNPVAIFTTTIPINAALNPDGTIPMEFTFGPAVEAGVESSTVVVKGEYRITFSAKVVPNDPFFSSRGSWKQEFDDQWALRRVGFSSIDEEGTSAWSADWLDGEPKLAPCIVAVIGSGVDCFHPELEKNLWVNPKEEPFNGKDDDENGFVDDMFGWNFRADSSNVMDYGGHDTHIAGVIAAGWNNGRGIAGVNPTARIMVLKVANCLGQTDSITVSQAIAYAVDHGARVINLSYDGPRHSHVFQLAVDYAVSKGVLIVGPAGNESEDTAGHSVADARGVFTVAGTTIDDKRVGFSNWGQAVDVAAPALDVLSLRARGTDFLLAFGENPNYKAGAAITGEEKNLYRAGGTSFCTPIVAGVASLLWSMEPELTLQQVRNKLLMGAEDIETPGWDQYTGVGLLNAKKAMEADPDYYLFARISKLTAARRGGQMFVDVQGQAEGSQFTGRWLQIGFGEEPGEDDWVTVGYSKEPVRDGLLGSIPISRFDQSGVWMVRSLIQDERQLVRQSRAQLDLK